MVKPNFESAVVWITFRGKSLPTVLRKLANYYDKNGNLIDYDSPMLNISYDDTTSEWIMSTTGDYWNEPKAVKMIKDKRIRGK